MSSSEYYNYFTFEQLQQEVLNEKNIDFDDYKNIEKTEFLEKYNISKQYLFYFCVNEYKKRYPKDYQIHLEICKNSSKDEIEEYKQKKNELEEDRKKQFEEKVNERKQHLIDVLIRQTEYTKEQAIEELEKTKYNVSEAINNYLNSDKKDKNNYCKTDELSSTNQKIYKEIREFMNYGSKMYERKKEYFNKMKSLQ